MDGEAQPATAQISVIDTPLDHAHDEAMPLVEWARTPMGHCRPKDEYASVTASTIHLESLSIILSYPLSIRPEFQAGRANGERLQVSNSLDRC